MIHESIFFNIFNFDEIPTYQIIMLNKELALLEFIEDSITLRQINDKGFTLQNYILNKNINNKHIDNAME